MIARLATAVVLGISLIAGTFAAEPVAPAAAWPPTIARKLPPPGVTLSAAERKQVEAALAEMNDALKDVTYGGADAIVLAKAVKYALQHDEFYDAKKDLERVEAIRKLTLERVKLIKEYKEIEYERRGPQVLGYYSELDGSYQPYGLIVPENLDLNKLVPLYVWLHGRGDKTADLQFVSQFMGTKAPGPLLPANAIVLHPFGRYCNGYKSAGEVDVMEAIENVKRRFLIDEDRIVIAGFSMGGAGAWHLGAHYADRWCAVHAGAGFVDVRRYQALTPDTFPSPVEQKLWGLYDVPDYRRNLLNVPVLAYSGEEDKQKAAADIMEAELAAEGLKIPHLIGPKMGHKYDPDSLKEVQERLAKLVEKGRDPYPRKVSLQTKTLRYPSMFWVSAFGLEKHWEDARIDADATDAKRITVTTKNVTAFSLVPSQSDANFFPRGVTVVVDGQNLRAGNEARDSSPIEELYFVKRDARWTISDSYPGDYQPLQHRRKLPGMQGPIDDAVLKPFIVWGPEPNSEPVGIVQRWCKFEHQHALDRWRMLMRGEPRQYQSSKDNFKMTRSGEPLNLLLWGTPQTNTALAALLPDLPLTWDDKVVGFGDLLFDATKVVPVMIYPNPKNMLQYVVINGGLTFREADDRTNSLQNPKLGDWAFIDVTEPPTAEAPGKVLASGFFDEQWKYVPEKK